MKTYLLKGLVAWMLVGLACVSWTDRAIADGFNIQTLKYTPGDGMNANDLEVKFTGKLPAGSTIILQKLGSDKTDSVFVGAGGMSATFKTLIDGDAKPNDKFDVADRTSPVIGGSIFLKRRVRPESGGNRLDEPQGRPRTSPTTQEWGRKAAHSAQIHSL